MEATPFASAGIQPAAGEATLEWQIEYVQKSLELFRVDATIQELVDCRSRNERLIEWYRGRRQLLAEELGL